MVKKNWGCTHPYMTSSWIKQIALQHKALRTSTQACTVWCRKDLQHDKFNLTQWRICCCESTDMSVPITTGVTDRYGCDTWYMSERTCPKVRTDLIEGPHGLDRRSVFGEVRIWGFWGPYLGILRSAYGFPCCCSHCRIPLAKKV